MHLPTPIAKPPRPHATAKATITFTEPDAPEVAVLLFTDLPPAGKRDMIYPGFAWTGGEIRVPAQGRAADMFPSCRSEWLPKLQEALAAAGYRGFGPPRTGHYRNGQVAVHANPAHGTGEATAFFAGPDGLLATLEDAFAEAGWTLIGTSKPFTVPAVFTEAAGAAAAAGAGRPAPTAPAATGGGIDADLRALLRDLAQTITDANL